MSVMLLDKFTRDWTAAMSVMLRDKFTRDWTAAMLMLRDKFTLDWTAWQSFAHVHSCGCVPLCIRPCPQVTGDPEALDLTDVTPKSHPSKSPLPTTTTTTTIHTPLRLTVRLRASSSSEDTGLSRCISAHRPPSGVHLVRHSLVGWWWRKSLRGTQLLKKQLSCLCVSFLPSTVYVVLLVYPA